jgi:hypothetical protein
MSVNKVGIRRKLRNLNDLCRTNDITKRLEFTPEYIPAVENFAKADYGDRIALIQSVRGAGSGEPQFVQDFLDDATAKGKQVYIPKLYNYQEDQFKGVTICNNMRYVIQNSSLVAIGYNPDSEGSKFDYGIVLVTQKPVKLLNPDMTVNDPIYNWMRGQKDDVKLESFIFDKVWINILACDKVELELKYIPRPDKDEKPQAPALAPLSAIEFGMVYGSERPFKILNTAEVKEQARLEDSLGLFKSYSKVALMLNQIYNPQRR